MTVVGPMATRKKQKLCGKKLKSYRRMCKMAHSPFATLCDACTPWLNYKGK